MSKWKRRRRVVLPGPSHAGSRFQLEDLATGMMQLPLNIEWKDEGVSFSPRLIPSYRPQATIAGQAHFAFRGWFLR